MPHNGLFLHCGRGTEPRWAEIGRDTPMKIYFEYFFFSCINRPTLFIETCEASISTRRAKPVVSTIWASFCALDLHESSNVCKLFPCCRSASGSSPEELTRWVSGGGLRTQERVCTTSL